MRLGKAGLTTVGLAALTAAAPASAQAFFPPIPRPHISVQIGPVASVPAVAPRVYDENEARYAPVQVAPQAEYENGFGVGQGFRGPQMFVMRTDRQIEGIRRDLVERVQRGFVSPQALAEFNTRVIDIRGDVRAAAADGVIQPDERMHIREDVDSLRFLEQRFRTTPAWGYGGGPRRWHWR